MRKTIINLGPIALCGYYLFAMAVDLLAGDSALRLFFASGAVIFTFFELLFLSGSIWSRGANIAATLLLPLCAFTGFGMICGFVPGKPLVGILYIIAFLLTLPIFCRSKTPGCISRAAAAVFAFLFFLLLSFGTLLASLGVSANYSAFSVLSPDGKHAANVLCIDEGALGGRTYVNIVKRRKHTTPTEGGKEIIDMGFIYPEDITIRWIDNGAIEFNGSTYEIS